LPDASTRGERAGEVAAVVDALHLEPHLVHVEPHGRPLRAVLERDRDAVDHEPVELDAPRRPGGRRRLHLRFRPRGGAARLEQVGEIEHRVARKRRPQAPAVPFHLLDPRLGSREVDTDAADDQVRDGGERRVPAPGAERRVLQPQAPGGEHDAGRIARGAHAVIRRERQRAAQRAEADVVLDVLPERRERQAIDADVAVGAERLRDETAFPVERAAARERGVHDVRAAVGGERAEVVELQRQRPDAGEVGRALRAVLEYHAAVSQPEVPHDEPGQLGLRVRRFARGSQQVLPVERAVASHHEPERRRVDQDVVEDRSALE